MNIKYNSLDDRAFLKKFFLLLNTMVSPDKELTPAEVDMLIEFLCLTDDKFKYQRFGTAAKHKVIQNAKQNNWNLTSININNKIYSLVKKEYLRRDSDGVIYVAKFITNALQSFRDNNKFELKIVMNGK